jgi:glycosyltransferase involved in cell wall biosynthesis
MGELGVTRNDCILFSTADWDEPYWTNKQHTANLLGQYGWRVLYVESVGLRSPKLSSKRDWGRLKRRLLRGVRCLAFGAPMRANGVWVLSPLVIPAAHRSAWLNKLNRWLLQYSLRRFCAQQKFSTPLVWTYHPYMLQAVDQLSYGALVYHCVDDLSAIPGIDAAAFDEAEIALLKKCDGAFVTNRTLMRKCSIHNGNTHYFPNVVEAEHFAQASNQSGLIPRCIQQIAKPRLVYHGVLSDFKIDLGLLLSVAKLQPAWQFVLIGQEREGQRDERLAALRSLPNVHLQGYVPYAQLPDYLRGMDVGMLPTLRNDYTKGMFPMKYYEYLAAGLPVVSTHLCAFDQSHPFIAFGDTPLEFIEAVQGQLRRGRLSEEEVACAVGENTWTRRMEKMLAIVGWSL